MNRKGEQSHNRAPDRFCEECGKKLERRRRSKMPRSLCFDHAMKSPERNAAISAGVKLKHTDPDYAARRAASIRKARLRAMEEGHPVAVEWKARLQRWKDDTSPEGVEARRRANERARSKKLAHIPIEYRDLYIGLLHCTELTAAERAVIVADQQARDTEHFIATGEMVNMKRNAK